MFLSLLLIWSLKPPIPLFFCSEKPNSKEHLSPSLLAETARDINIETKWVKDYLMEHASARFVTSFRGVSLNGLGCLSIEAIFWFSNSISPERRCPCFIIHLRHENFLPLGESLTAGTRRASRPCEEWLDLWHQMARKYGSFHFDQEGEEKPFLLRAVWQTAPWYVSSAAHFVCDKENPEGGREGGGGDPVLPTLVFPLKRGLFCLWHPARKMWTICQ